ncbi:MAG: N-acetylmuramoyl-L-alanine amidase-like domain-containing protein [Myxococcota bacterium]
MIGKAAALLFLASPLTPEIEAEVQHWFDTVGERQDGESFGELSTRAARLKLGVPYDRTPQRAGPETLRIHLDALHCVSLVEYADAVARCVWSASPNPECFAAEVEATRYRDGSLVDYASRLHYFTDWLTDNQRRSRLRSLVEAEATLRERYFFMTHHPASYPALKDQATARAIAAVERRLSNTDVRYVPRNEVSTFQSALKTGDIVAFITRKPGLLVTHTGYIVRDNEGRPRLLHASSHNGRVVLSRGDLADYVLRRPERRGIIVARPLAPKG